MSSTEHPRQRPVLALGLRIISALLIATMFMLAKLAIESGVAVPEVMFWRLALTVPLLLGYLALTSGLHRLRTKRVVSHGLRAGLGITGMMFNFAAVSLLPLAESTTLGFTAPLFAVILTAAVLQQRVGLWRWIAVLFGFSGVLVIAQPGSVPIPVLGATCGLMAGLFNAIISFQIRELGRTDEPISVVFWFSIFGGGAMLMLMPFFMIAHTPYQLMILMALGVTGTLGQLFMTAALRLGPVASVIVMDYTALIWATGFGYLIWDQLPPMTTWFGAPLIVIAGLVIAWREHHLARNRAPVSAIEGD